MKSDYPLVDIEFLIDKLKNSSKIDSTTYLNVGSTHSFSLKGSRPLHKRLVIVREIDKCVGFMQSTGLAALYGFMGDLLMYFEKQKGWKEGAYVAKK
jgi:hypothetical protein